MGRLRTAVRTLADVDLQPDELLTRLDDLVTHLTTEETDTTSGTGTTCLYAIYDPISRICTLARAGHPPPAAVTPDGQAYFLDLPAGPPLGLGTPPFESATTQLPEGTLLAFYTNGLLNPQHTDPDETLSSLLATLAQPSPTLNTTCDRILTTLLTHPPTDDIALLVARTKTLPTHHIATFDLPFHPATVARARHHATTQLTTWNLSQHASTTELIVSELVTNAIRYGKPPIQLRLIHNTGTLITELHDTSHTTPTSNTPIPTTRTAAVSTSSTNSPSTGAPATPPRARPSGPNSPSPCPDRTPTRPSAAGHLTTLLLSRLDTAVPIP